MTHLREIVEPFTINEIHDPNGPRATCYFGSVALLQAFLDGLSTAGYALGAPMPEERFVEMMAKMFGLELVSTGRYDKFIMGREKITLDDNETVVGSPTPVNPMPSFDVTE